MAFEHVSNLETLNRSYNNIPSLSPALFHNNKKIKTLDLSRNKLQVRRDPLQAEHLLESTSLTYLDVSFCNITSVSSETFSSLPNLETLKITGNSLIQFDADFIQPLNNLKIMHMKILNTSAVQKFCNHFINNRKLTVFPPCPPKSSTRLTNREKTELNVITAGSIMCACAVVSYVLLTRCKTLKTDVAGAQEVELENAASQRRLPPLPESNESYEIPVLPRKGSIRQDPNDSV